MNAEIAATSKPTGAPTSRVIAATALLASALPTHAASVDVAGPGYSVLIVSFLFLMGISQAGVVFCAICRLVYAQWAKPFYRLAEICTLAFAPFAIVGLFLVYYLAKDDLFYWLSSADDHLSPWLSGDWLLIRNLLGLILFYGLSAIYVLKGLRLDLADSTEQQSRKVERQQYLMSPWILVAFVICNTLFAWDFAMMLIPHWHSTVFPIHFWFGNMFAGTAAMMAFPALLSRFSKTEYQFGPREVRQLSMMITAFTVLWLYFFWAQFFVIWFGNLPHEADPLWRQMYGHYSPYYWAMMFGCFFIPFVVLLFAIFNRSIAVMCVVGFGISLGVWFNKYLMVVPVFSPDARPLDNLMDVGLSIVLLAGFLAAVVLLAKRLPVYAYWELKLGPNPDR